VLATFETGLYDERGTARGDFGLARVFEMHKTGNVEGPHGNAYYARVMRDHPVLAGFEGAAELPGAEYRVPIEAPGDAVLTVVPPYPAFPPEMVYPRTEGTGGPAIVLRERGNSRLAYLPGDTDRSYWRSGNPDLSRLLRNIVAWLVRDRVPVSVEGPGMLEIFAWETEPGFALHLLNYTNPNMLRGWFAETYPVGAQRVRVELPEGVRGGEASLLRAGLSVPVKRAGRLAEFTIPGVADYEVAVIAR